MLEPTPTNTIVNGFEAGGVLIVAVIGAGPAKKGRGEGGSGVYVKRGTVSGGR